MDRWTRRNQRQPDDYDDTASLPPWEQRNVSQVPYMAPDSPPLSQTEQNALPSLWASRENGQHERSKSVSASHRYEGHDDARHQWGAKTPLTAPPTRASPPPMPYESTKIPSGPKSAPPLPALVKGPPSPPDSTRLSRSSTTKSGCSPHHSPPLGSKPTITAMPGTMSARERSRSRHRIQSSRDEGNKEEQEHVPFGKRFKSAIKDIFKKNPVDETNFERIEDRHWADE